MVLATQGAEITRRSQAEAALRVGCRHDGSESAPRPVTPGEGGVISGGVISGG